MGSRKQARTYSRCCDVVYSDTGPSIVKPRQSWVSMTFRMHDDIIRSSPRSQVRRTESTRCRKSRRTKTGGHATLPWMRSQSFIFIVETRSDSADAPMNSGVSITVSIDRIKFRESVAARYWSTILISMKLLLTSHKRLRSQPQCRSHTTSLDTVNF